jgi:hypothetical protein
MVEFKNMKLQISKSQQKYTTRQQVLKVQAWEKTCLILLLRVEFII